MCLSERRSSRSNVDAGSLRATSTPVSAGEHGRPLVGEEEDVGVHDLGRVEAEGEDPQRHPRLVGRDGEHDRRAVTRLLAELGGARGVEAGGHEDLRAVRVEVEHLGRVGREEEPVVDRPLTDRVTATAQDGDVERVDLRLLHHLGASPARSTRRRRRTRPAGPAARPRAAAAAGSSRRRARPSSGCRAAGTIEPTDSPVPLNSKLVT